MDSTSLAHLEWEILTVHLQVPPEACPPNPYWLLGLAPDMCDPATVQWAGQQRIAHLRAIADPALQPAVPYVIARVKAAMASLAASAAPQQSPLQVISELETQPIASAIAVSPGKLASQWTGDPDPGSQRLIKVAAVVGGGTLALLLLLIISTRWWNSAHQRQAASGDSDATTLQASADVQPAPPASSPPTSASPTQPTPVAVAEPSALPMPVNTLPASAPPVSAPPVNASPVSAVPTTTPPVKPTPMATSQSVPRRLLPVSIESLPVAVDLPSLVARGDGQVLFSLQTAADNLALDSGASQIAWELKRQPDAEGQAVWAVIASQAETRELVDTDERPIGWFLVTAEDVRFRWADHATSPTFNQLRKCVLELAVAEQKHRIALRTPQTIAALPITLLQRREKVELPAFDWPPPEMLFVELLECTGFTVPPQIKPNDQRVAGKTRGAIVLPGWSRAEINFGIAGSNDAPLVIFESVFYLNNGQTELTRTRVQQTLQNLQDNLEKEKQTLANYQQRGAAAVHDANRVRNSAPNGGGNAQAFLLLRDKQLTQLAQEVAKCNAGVQRMRSAIPRTEEAIASVQQLTPQLDEWTHGTEIHWRVGAETTHGEIILMTTRP